MHSLVKNKHQPFMGEKTGRTGRIDIGQYFCGSTTCRLLAMLHPTGRTVRCASRAHVCSTFGWIAKMPRARTEQDKSAAGRVKTRAADFGQ
jgi:hypothetical protein